MKLSTRHVQLLAALAAGMTLREAARHLGIAYKTTRNHSTEMQRRLGARTMAHAVAIGHHKGLLVAGRPS